MVLIHSQSFYLAGHLVVLASAGILLIRLKFVRETSKRTAHWRGQMQGKKPRTSIQSGRTLPACRKVIEFTY